MRKIGSIAEQIEKEAWLEWAGKPVQPLKYEYKPNDFKLSEAAKEAFSRGISLFKL